MARDGGGLDLSFKHHEDSGSGHQRQDRDDIEEEDDDDDRRTARDREDEQEEDETAAVGDDLTTRPTRGAGGRGSREDGSGGRRRKPLAPQWVNPDWTEPTEASSSAPTTHISEARLNRSWEDRPEDKDTRTINGVCVMMDPAAFGGQPTTETVRGWAARNMED